MLIRELIEIKERVDKDDFVLKLTEGVAEAGKTLADYVVTTDLVANFDDALGFIKGAVESKKSRGTYLHGSFGSGKSHFMAVLNLLLQDNPDARALPRLAPVVTKHDQWLPGKKFLMVPYHMIGAPTLEDRIFEGYVSWVEKHHPDAPTPPLFRSQSILENAASLREKMGEDAFFKALNQGQVGGGGGWGELSGGWTAESYEEAAADPTSDEHGTLVGDLVQHLITSVRHEGEYLDLDKGLAALSRHAEGLGYDAVILFLDELVLWLASRSGDVNFLNQEVNKLAKLVEAQEMRRPVPIVSFIARQRDLRELVGENVAGATNLNFLDQLKYFEGRFEMIKLGDNNLPEIVAERLLKPKDAAARKQIDTEFEKTAKVRDEVRQVLLTSHADPAAFRNLYPFSPALVETLVAVSSLLQRERTALKIMLQLLVDQRDSMQLGELVPVGDLYDQISQGDDAFSNEMKKHFMTADKLYRQNLKPMLEEMHELSFADAEKLPVDASERTALRNDDRLIKTVLLAALAPQVESLRSLTPARLAALNHGTIKSPIPGQEASLVLSRLNDWAGRVGQLKVDDSTPPVVSIQLTGVDVDNILSKVDTQDNFGNRLRCLKEILFETLDLKSEDKLWLEHGFRWRGTDRRCKVIFKNVWEADFDLLESDNEEWKLVVDYPLDADPSKSPASDRAKLQEFHEARSSTRTVVWLPAFFSDKALSDLGKLVRLEKILAPHAFDGYVSDLSMQDRTSAKSILTNQRDALRSRMVTYLQTAYGLREDRGGILDPIRSIEGVDQFQSLSAGLQLKVPGETHLKDAMESLLDQALSSQYPQHPIFDDNVKLSSPYVQRVLDAFEGALQESGGRFEVEKPHREVIRMISNPLKIGEMASTHFVPGEHWKDHFRRQAPTELDGVEVSDLRSWIDWGVPPILENMVILACAAQLNCSFTLHGSPYQPTLKDLPDDCRLKTQELPSQEAWDKSLTVQHALLGRADLPKLLTAQGLDDFSNKVREHAEKYESSVARLVNALETEAGNQSLNDDFDRLEASREAQRFLSVVKTNQGNLVVEAIAAFTSEQPDEAISNSIKKADDVLGVLLLDRKSLDMALGLHSPLREEAEKLETELIGALKRNEYVVSLAAVSKRVNDEALALVQKQLTSQPKPPEDEGEEETPDPAPTPKTVDHIALETKLKKRYKGSQIEGDSLPSWMPESLVESILEVHRVGDHDGVLLTPTLKALLRVCEDATIDLESGVLSIPSHGIERKITIGKPGKD